MTSAPPTSSAQSAPGESPFFSASDAARDLTILARQFAAAFTTFAGSTSPGTDASRIGFATASRVLGEWAQAFAALVPESVLLAPARAEGAEAPFVPEASPLAMLGALDRALARISARATSVADGALLRAVAHARVDLAELRADLAPLEGSRPGV